MAERFLYAHLHGFGNGAQSKKGTYLAELFRQNGKQLFLADWNHADAVPMSFTPALEYLDGWLQEKERQLNAEGDENTVGPVKLRLIGYSCGGYLAARYAQLHPDKVDSLLLISPAFRFDFNFMNLLEDEKRRKFEETGHVMITTPRKPEGVPTSPTGEYEVSYPFSAVEDCRTHPPFPIVSCPTTIIHGEHDPVVPLSMSHDYIAHLKHHRDNKDGGSDEAHAPDVVLDVLNDDHELGAPASIARIQQTVLSLWNISEPE